MEQNSWWMAEVEVVRRRRWPDWTKRTRVANVKTEERMAMAMSWIVFRPFGCTEGYMLICGAYGKCKVEQARRELVCMW